MEEDTKETPKRAYSFTCPYCGKKIEYSTLTLIPMVYNEEEPRMGMCAKCLKKLNLKKED